MLFVSLTGHIHRDIHRVIGKIIGKIKATRGSPLSLFDILGQSYLREKSRKWCLGGFCPDHLFL